MADIEVYLKERASVLAPTKAQLAAAARSHRHLRESLATGSIGCRIQNDYLSGSYARHTAIRPLDDVDVILEIDPSQWKRPWLRTLLSQLPAPEQVLETFARAIRYRYHSTGTPVRTQRRSVGLMMEHLHIDVVPSVPHEREGWLYVPDRTEGSWIASAPAIHAAVATEVNAACGASFKPLVRLLKAWNGSLPSTAAIKSFAVETIAARLMGALPQVTLWDGMTVFYDFVAWRGGFPTGMGWRDGLGIEFFGWTGASLPDIAGTGANILAGVEKERLVKFCTAARVTRDALMETRRARDGGSAWARIEQRFRGGLERV